LLPKTPKPQVCKLVIFIIFIMADGDQAQTEVRMMTDDGEKHSDTVKMHEVAVTKIRHTHKDLADVSA